MQSMMPASHQPTSTIVLMQELAMVLEACAQTLTRLAATVDEMQGPAVPYLPIKAFVQRYPLFTEGAVRKFLLSRATNGFQDAVVEINRKILIEVEAFFRWIAQHKTSRQSVTGMLIPPQHPHRQRSRR